ncbi:MAG TPA: two-component regulator propeller domain-containing protein [Bacteroidota bacterium]|nr:two-component regulator propeller domain-containing protein [Bacteroidota bacterium]
MMAVFSFISSAKLSRRIALLFISLLAGASGVLPQTLPTKHWDLADPFKSYVHESWTSEHGLPQNVITAIEQTSDGYLWLGTQSGLVRFNGIAFMNLDRYNTPAMKNEFIRVLAVAEDSTLWVGTDHGGVVSFRGRVVTQHRLVDSLTVEGTHMIVPGKDHTVWAAISGLGVWKKEADRWVAVAPSASLTSVWSGFVDSDGSLWLGGQGSLVHLRGDTVERFGSREGLPEGRILALIRDSRGDLIVGTRGGGLLTLKQKKFVPLQGSARYAHSTISGLCNDAEGGLWIGSYDEGLLHYDGALVSRCIGSQSGNPLHVGPVFLDKEGSLWFGTAGDGLHRLRRSVVRMRQLNESNVSPQIWAVVQRDNELWVGTRSSGLRRFAGNRFQHVSQSRELGQATVSALLDPGDGSLIVGCEDGLYKWTASATVPLTLPGGKPFTNVYALIKDRRGVVWIGAESLYKMSEGVITEVPGMPAGFEVNCLLEDRTGKIWIGTDANGVGVLENGRARFFTTEEGLRSNTVLSMYEDSGGEIWCGTQGGGLSRLSNGKWSTLLMDQGLLDNCVNSIAGGENTFVWLSTNRGLFGGTEQSFIAAFEGKITRVDGGSITAQDGLPTTEFAGGLQNCSVSSKDGVLWFASMKGLVGVTPEPPKKNPLPPTVRIEGIDVNGQSSELTESMEIGPDVRSVQFSYIGLTFLMPLSTRYRYRLDGVDDDWLDGRNQRQATYTNLSPGTYVFHVQAANDDGLWSKEQASIHITILPHFWQTVWFKIFCLLGIVAGVLGSYRIRVRSMLRREEELNQRIASAVADIKVLHGLIPICANCKKVRDDKGYWSDVAKYITDNSDAVMTHGICPECAEKIYGPDMMDRIKNKREQNPAG